MNTLKMVFLWIVLVVVFFHKKIGCTNKTEIKDGYQYANRKLSLRGYTVICTPEDLVMN